MKAENTLGAEKVLCVFRYSGTIHEQRRLSRQDGEDEYEKQEPTTAEEGGGEEGEKGGLGEGH